MENPFQIFGPFAIENKQKIADKARQNTFWNDCDELFYQLSAAKGIYLFSLRNATNFTPRYVGMTHRDFRREVFSLMTPLIFKPPRKCRQRPEVPRAL